jgi:hypothetical protein
MKIIKLSLLLVTISIVGCGQPNEEAIMVGKVNDYFSAWNDQRFTSQAYQNFTTDTSYTWHNEKKGAGSASVFNPNSGWKQWDVAMNGTYTYTNIIVDTDARTITGDFTETTDFLKEIGMPEGFAAKITYWYNDDLKVTGKLYGWDPNNRSMGTMVKPMADWAKVNNRELIEQVYPDERFTPSTANAVVWKQIIANYKAR